MNAFAGLVFMVAAAAFSCSVAAQKSFDATAVVKKINDLDPDKRAPYIREIYRAKIVGACRNHAALGADDAEDVFNVLKTMYFYSPAPNWLSCLENTFQRIEKTNRGRSFYRNLMVDSLVQGRRFIEAKSLASKYSIELDVPSVVTDDLRPDHSYPALWRLSSDGRSIIKFRSVLSETYIAAVVHPNCKFSKAAFQFISDNPPIRSSFSKHSLLLLPADRRLVTEAVSDWNAANPGMEMVYIDKPVDWGFVRVWETPQFFLIRNGRVMQQIIGWRPDESPEALSRMISALEANQGR